MTSPEDKSSFTRITKIFNYIGGTLIFFGICYLISSNWDVLTDFLKVFTTLGVAIATFVTASLLTIDKKYNSTSAVFYILAGLLFPLGLSVTLDIFNLLTNTEVADIAITGICLCIFLPATLYFQRNILLFFSIIYGSLFIFSISNFIRYQVYHLGDDAVFLYGQHMVLGLYYVFISYYFTLYKKNNALIGILYFLGDFFILFATFGLAGLIGGTPGTVFWEILAPVLIFLSFFLSVPCKSKALLYLGAMALIVYIPCVRAKYYYLFGDLGWPMVLVCSGLFLIMLGYLVVYLQKRISRG